MKFEPTTSCIRGKRLPARPQKLHGRGRTPPRLILKSLDSIFLYKGTRQKPSGIRTRLQKPSGIDSIANADQIFTSKLNVVMSVEIKCFENEKNPFLEKNNFKVF